MSRQLTPKESRVLDMIVRADRAGCPLDLLAIKERLGTSSNAGLADMVPRMEREGHISIDRTARPHTFRRPVVLA